MDGCLNIVLTEADCNDEHFSEILIRGNNVLYVSVVDKKRDVGESTENNKSSLTQMVHL
jgi:hypothetical protein